MEQCSRFPIKMCAKQKVKNQHIYFIRWSLATAHLYFPSVVPSFLEYRIHAASLRGPSTYHDAVLVPTANRLFILIAQCYSVYLVLK